MYSEREKSKILAHAEKYTRKKKLKQAIAEYQKLLSDNPQDLHIRSLVGDLYLKSGQKEKAISEFKNMADFYEKRGLYSQSLAIYKKINRLDPDDINTSIRMADLYSSQGFISEAKDKYLKIAIHLQKEGKKKETIAIYEKILDLDREDYETKLNLADLYSKEQFADKAVEMFNEVAELKIKEKDLKKSKEILNKARAQNKDDSRTLANLVEVLKEEKNREEALGLIHDVLKKDENNLKALSLLGNLYFEEQKFGKAEETFEKIISLNPKDFEARFRLGRMLISQGRLDEAFNHYEPLVDSLIKRQKEDKAIGLLGLILSTKQAHLLTLEKLASIYKSNNQTRNLEIAYRIILEECRRKNLREKSLSVLKELISICPLDEESYAEYKKLCEELGVPEEKEIPGEPSVLREEAKEIIEENLAKADLYIEQGLIRNARRILENLRIKFPDEHQIEQKLAALNQFAPEVKEDEIPQRLEKAFKEETRLFRKDLEKEKEGEISAFPEEEEKITVADIFAETDIIPEVPLEEEGKGYYDLEDRIDKELEAIHAICGQQLKGDTTVMEKELADILSEFKKDVDEKIGKEDYESRFNLGIAYMEQGLIDEAIQELQLASRDEKRAVDCYSVISACFRRKRDFKRAIERIEKAIDLSEKGSDQSFRLKYEMASVYEEMREWEKAFKLYEEIKKWNPDYLEVAEKIEEIGKKAHK